MMVLHCVTTLDACCLKHVYMEHLIIFVSMHATV